MFSRSGQSDMLITRFVEFISQWAENVSDLRAVQEPRGQSVMQNKLLSLPCLWHIKAKAESSMNVIERRACSAVKGG